MNETENKYGELTEDTDELLALDNLGNDESVPEELIALDGENAEEEANGKGKGELITVVGVRFKASGKIYYFDPANMTFANGENVIVDTSRGMEYGTVCMPNREVYTGEIVLPIRSVLRKATPEDTARRRHNEDLEITAYNTFIERISHHGLEMKLIDVECTFDNSKLLFYFSAETRIDFRELVRELASIFHTRIELRQIGIRDETRMLGGLGVCGRPFCCSTFLTDFVQVSVKMVKAQNLSLNAAKISGACGKLMCCMTYEYETYLAEKAITPEKGAEVMTPDGEGVVFDSNPMTGLVKVKLCGTAEEAAPVIFVRDDLVRKSEYNGEKLTRTPLPQKRNNVQSANNFEVQSPFRNEEGATAVEETAGKDKKKREHNGDAKQKNNGRNERNDRNERFEKNGKNSAPKNAKDDAAATPKQGGKSGEQSKYPAPKQNGRNGDQGKPQNHKPGGKGGDQNKNRPQQKPIPTKPQQGGDKPHEGGKKPFKPYFKKNK